jgi:hypothetical protein
VVIDPNDRMIVMGRHEMSPFIEFRRDQRFFFVLFFLPKIAFQFSL